MTTLALVVALVIQALTSAPGLPQASPGSEMAALPVQAHARTAIETVTPYVVLDAWSPPTPTAAPATPAPAPPILIVPDRPSGPMTLVFWDGARVDVQEAGRTWDAQGQYRWEVSDDAGGWHSDSDDCGAGLTIIGGHVSLHGADGVFGRLAGIGKGQQVVCTDGDGTVHYFEPVDYVELSSGSSLSPWLPNWRPALLLYTCTRELDGRIVLIRFRKAGNS